MTEWNNPEPLNQELIDAFVVAAHHDLPEVKRLLAEDPRLLNENATWVETGLGAASHTGQREIAEYLLEQGAPLDVCAAAMLNRGTELTAMLQENPALLRATGAHGLSLLFHAAIGGNDDLVKLLTSLGAPFDEADGRSSALHAAAGRGDVEIVQYLLAQGANFESLDHENRTPLDVAEATGQDATAAAIRAHLGQAE
jgi:uncharacterized protein